MPRLFIALEVAAEVKVELGRVQAQLASAHLPVRWTRPDMMHLTLLFLGETDEREVAPIERSLADSVAGIHAHSLELGKLGAFPTLARPKVIWCAVGGMTDELARLNGAIAAAVAGVVPRPDDRPYTPHLTIGRVRQDAHTAQRRLVGDVIGHAPAPSGHHWLVDEVTLYESVPSSLGVRHTKRLSVPLENAIKPA